MKCICFLFLFISYSIFSQETIETSFTKKTELKADTFIASNNFETHYYIKNNALYNQSTNNTLSYSNIQLGNITSANTFNPLKINVFYKDFNTAVILDNRLAEIFKIDFNTIKPYKSISHVSTGHDNTLWVFNQDTQQLELYDYKVNTTRAQTLPIKSNILDIKSNYNYCWLLTKDTLLVYNYFGSLIQQIKNTGYTSICESNGNLILKKDNSLLYLKKDTENIVPISTQNLLINQFFVTNETLYIYNNKILQQYQLKTN
jgi:hypothetical protein